VPTVTIRLHGHCVSFDPPQRVATLAVEHEGDGHVIELMPVTGEEGDDGEAVLRPLTSSAPSSIAQEDRTGPGIDARYLKELPLVGEIDLANLPADYKRSSVTNIKYFAFAPGDRYSVTLVSEVIVQAIVIAE